MTHSSLGNSSLGFLPWLWFACTALSLAFVAFDLSKIRQAQWTLAERIHRLSRVLNALYMGPFCALAYHAVQQRPDEKSSIWKRAARSTMHCAAGQMSGMLLAALLFSGLPREWELAAEYLGGLGVGLLIFKAPLFRPRYWSGVASQWVSEMLAMNAMMAGQIPIMALAMRMDERTMDPSSGFFWMTMSLSFIVGSLTTYPFMVWLLFTPKAGGHGDRSVWPKLAAMMTWVALAMGIELAYLIGYFRGH